MSGDSAKDYRNTEIRATTFGTRQHSLASEVNLGWLRAGSARAIAHAPEGAHKRGRLNKPRVETRGYVPAPTGGASSAPSVCPPHHQRADGTFYGRTEGSMSRRNVLWRNARFYGPTERSMAERKVLRAGGTFHGETEGSMSRRNVLRRNGRFYEPTERSTAERKVLRADGTFYGETEGSTSRRNVLRPNGRFYEQTERSMAERKVL